MIDLSIIIPCYNSAALVEKRVREFEAVLHGTRWSWEILLCDDGSLDDTARVCRELERQEPARRFLPSAANRGRGRNVSDGIRQSRGRYVGFADADMSTRAFYVLPSVQALESGFEVAEAHRTYKLRLAHLPFIFHRYAAHVTYAALVQSYLGISGHDTETGFKFFRREAGLALADKTASAGWFWDTEVIANAHELGYRVAEVPSLFVRTKGMASTVRLLSDSVSQFRALTAFAGGRRGGALRRSCCA